MVNHQRTLPVIFVHLFGSSIDGDIKFFPLPYPQANTASTSTRTSRRTVEPTPTYVSTSYTTRRHLAGRWKYSQRLWDQRKCLHPGLSAQPRWTYVPCPNTRCSESRSFVCVRCPPMAPRRRPLDNCLSRTLNPKSPPSKLVEKVKSLLQYRLIWPQMKGFGRLQRIWQALVLKFQLLTYSRH